MTRRSTPSNARASSQRERATRNPPAPCPPAPALARRRRSAAQPARRWQQVIPPMRMQQYLVECAMHELKLEMAAELGLLPRLAEYGWGGLPAKECGRIGGLIAKRVGLHRVCRLVEHGEGAFLKG